MNNWEPNWNQRGQGGGSDGNFNQAGGSGNFNQSGGYPQGGNENWGNTGGNDNFGCGYQQGFSGGPVRNNNMNQPRMNPYGNGGNMGGQGAGNLTGGPGNMVSAGANMGGGNN